jgi:hypothetical protein
MPDMQDVTLYRLWYECLARSDRSKWTGVVHDAFDGADGRPWIEWWEECRGLFEDDTPKYLLEPIETQGDFDWWWNKWRIPEANDSFVVMVNLLNSKADLMAAFDRLLSERHPWRPGRPPVEQRGAEFEPMGRPNLRAIAKAIEVYDNRAAGPLWKVGVICRVNFNQIPNNGDPDSDQRRVLAATVSRYLKRAKALLRGVERGVFPAP